MILAPVSSSEQSDWMRQYRSHFGAAICSVREKIGDPNRNMNDEIIVAIILLGCDVS